MYVLSPISIVIIIVANHTIGYLVNLTQIV
nr:MAG TPA: hypothetical protein [Caudoviricetes sp.]